MILNFGGLKFSNTAWTDEEVPFFKVDTLGYDVNDLPEAEVFTPYPVYEAIAFDKFDGVYHGSAECEVLVTVNKKGSSQPLTVQNGYFTPMETGVYEIRYTTQDIFGYTAEKVLTVEANNVSEMTHEWKTPIQEDAVVGVKTVIPEHEVAGTYGEYSLKTIVYENATGKEI